jgi:hypothetical protein
MRAFGLGPMVVECGVIGSGQSQKLEDAGRGGTEVSGWAESLRARKVKVQTTIHHLHFCVRTA